MSISIPASPLRTLKSTDILDSKSKTTSILWRSGIKSLRTLRILCSTNQRRPLIGEDLREGKKSIFKMGTASKTLPNKRRKKSRWSPLAHFRNSISMINRNWKIICQKIWWTPPVTRRLSICRFSIKMSYSFRTLTLTTLQFRYLSKFLKGV